MKKILIVEDDLTTARIIQKALENHGFATFIASDGQIGLQTLNNSPDFNLIISDMQMPNLNGQELIEAIQKTPELKKIPLILISGIVSLKQISNVLENGASRFLPKPLDIKYLIKCTNEVII